MTVPLIKDINGLNRYLLCEVVLADPLERKNITQELVLYNLKDAVIRLHGDFGWAACTISLSVKYLNAYTGVVLIRCRKEFFQLLWSALPFITCLVGRNRQYPCFFNTLHVGGVAFGHRSGQQQTRTCASNMTFCVLQCRTLPPGH
ncbi:ribonuclease P/MRP protein subunit POP5 isoform X4 [Pleurodeles waltl]|uniref:ribonuclease P/MRP protein subunit POP5 isoform X4 n=1 Tax=Pleurodeles waltl TaxID=8319 RepID=UPI0037094F25